MLGSALLLGALASTASAAATPECFTPETWDRPGLGRAAHRRHGAAVVAVDLYCWDYENDSLVIDGGGPGEHLDGPKALRGGDPGGAEVPVWHYRTTTASGQEATTFWATDDLGARSDDTPLSVEVGPGVDRLPSCLPTPGAADFLPVYARAGATRRFGVVCSDADHDPLAVRVGSAPARGALSTFARRARGPRLGQRAHGARRHLPRRHPRAGLTPRAHHRPPGPRARLRLSPRAAGLLRSSGSVSFALSARMPAGRAGRGTVHLRRR